MRTTPHPGPVGPPSSRRGFLIGATAAAAGTALLLAGCGDGDGGEDSPSSDAKDGFPVTVPGKPGGTTVKKRPHRVAACGYIRDTDLALALGAELVLATRNNVFRGGLAPWQKPRTPPTLVDSTGSMPIEKIASARPDVILASDDYTLADDFGKLSRIAPTLGYRTGIGEDGWDEMIRRAGDVLGERARADRLVAQVRKQIADVRTAHPQFAGKTFTFGPVTPDGQVHTTSSTEDAAATFFRQLGLELSPKVTSLPESSTPGRSLISQERLDLLDADVLVLTFVNDKAREDLESKELFKRLKAVERGSYIPLDMPTAVALAFPSVLSIPYGLDTMVPKLTAAVKKSADSNGG